jgi:hypothetical protein
MVTQISLDDKETAMDQAFKIEVEQAVLADSIARHGVEFRGHC